ncbi:MAG: hypothetical protein NC548_33665 [Lachnospiraceae bacterium]|nr:hypothetical protein [Lachnospiraceae bacterium]
MDINLSEKILKHKIRNGNSKTMSVILLVLFIIIGYTFFFTSQYIFGKNYNYEVSLPGSEITIDTNHKVKLIRSDIDAEKNMLEYEFEFINTNYDGSNDYNIKLNAVNKKGKIIPLKHNVVCDNSDLYVIRVQLPNRWTAVSVQIDIPNIDKSITSEKFYSDKNSLYSTAISSDSSREYFLKLDTQRNIETLEQDIKNLENENNSLELKITEINNNITALAEKMAYMTSNEIKTAETEMQTLEHNKSSFKTQIDNNKKEIKELEDNIKALNSKL